MASIQKYAIGVALFIMASLVGLTPEFPVQAAAVTTVSEEVAKIASRTPDYARLHKEFCTILGIKSGDCQTKHLSLLKSYPVDVSLSQGVSQFDLSGLLLHKGTLYGINDKKDLRIYRLVRKRRRFIAKKAFDISHTYADGLPRGKRDIDFEGLASFRGNFVVINENFGHAIEVKRDGSASILPLEPKTEMLPTKGNGLEAVATDERRGHIYLVKEREPRRIYKYDIKSGKLLRDFDVSSPLAMKDGAYLKVAGKEITPTCSDAFVDNDYLYLLARESETVLKIDISKENAGLVDFVSFSRSGVASSYDTGEPYGLAEGLTMDRTRIYIAVDNNGKPLRTDSSDTRPRIFIFKRPSEF